MTDTLDVLTLAEAKAAILNNAGTGNDTLLATYVTGTSRFMDRVFGPIVQRTITGEAQDGGSGDSVVFLDYRPVLSVTTVTEYANAVPTVCTQESAASQPAQAFIAELIPGMLRRRRSGRDSAWACGRQNIVITYEAGRYANTASVDPRFKEAAGIILANAWRKEHGMGQMPELQGVTYMLPNAAKALLADELQLRQP